MLPIVKRRLQVVRVSGHEPERVTAVGRHVTRAGRERARVQHVGHA